jgi:hypothetical protein
MDEEKMQEIRMYIAEKWDKQNSQVQWYFDALTSEEREFFRVEFRTITRGTNWTEWYLANAADPPMR